MGNPASTTALHKVSASTALSIVILSDEHENPHIADAITLRTVMSLKGLKEGSRCHIVAEMRYVPWLKDSVVTFSLCPAFV